MMRQRFLARGGMALMVVEILVTFPALASAASDAPWLLTGSNTARYEYYDAENGVGRATPYAFENSQYYDEANLDLSRQISPYQKIQLQTAGVMSRSQYRTSDRDLVLERASLKWERGDIRIPYRIEGGDVYGYFTHRTLQTSLKGALLELQPEIKLLPDFTHSLVYVTGTDFPAWQGLRRYVNVVNGLSWLMEGADGVKLSVNMVSQRRGRARDNSRGEIRKQKNYSLAGATPITMGGTKHELEAEFAYFEGDHDAAIQTSRARKFADQGVYAQMKGGILDGQYTLKFEDYGENFIPAAAAITGNRRNLEADYSRSFAGGANLGLRAQHYRDNQYSGTPRFNDVVGFNVSGKLIPRFKNLSISLDGSMQNYRDRAPTRTMTQIGNARFAWPANERMNWNLSVSERRQLNTANYPRQDMDKSLQAVLGFSRTFTWKMWRGTMNPALTATRFSAPQASRGQEWAPSLALNMARERHNLAGNLSYDVQTRSLPTSVDARATNASLKYDYRMDRKSFGMEASYAHRISRPGTGYDAYKYSAYFTLDFDHEFSAPPGTVSAPPAVEVEPEPEDEEADLPGRELTTLRPGISLADALDNLAAVGLNPSSQRPDLVLFDAPFHAAIGLRQTLALVVKDERVDRSSLTFQFTSVGDTSSAERDFKRVRDFLFSRYGKPAAFWERGDFAPDLAAELRTGRFARVYEWNFGRGRLRFGIPERLDGRVRMELQFAGTFPSLRENRWSVEEAP